MSTKPDCLFCRIVAGELPSKKIYEDEHAFAFHDINPVAPVHFMIVPRHHIDNLYDVDPAREQALGHILALAGRLAREQGLDDGFRVIVNTGRVGRQEVYHLHVHVLGGPDRLAPMLSRR